MSGFVKPGGSFFDQTLCMSPEFDLKSELMSGRVKALTKTDFLVWRDLRTTKRKSCFIIIRRNSSSGIIKILSLPNLPKIGALCLSKRHTTFLKV